MTLMLTAVTLASGIHLVFLLLAAFCFLACAIAAFAKAPAFNHAAWLSTGLLLFVLNFLFV